MNYIWTENALEYIRLNAGLLKDELIASHLSRLMNRKISIHAVRKQRRKLGIKKKHGRGVCVIDKSDNDGMSLHITGV